MQTSASIQPRTCPTYKKEVSITLVLLMLSPVYATQVPHAKEDFAS